MTRPADLILLGGDVLTVDEDFTAAEAVAVRDGVVQAVGDSAAVRALAGPRTRLIDLRGRTVLPGINDSHLHACAWGLSRPPLGLDVGFPAVRSLADVAAAVGAAAREAGPGQWVVGRGWDLGYLDECRADPRRTPDRADLDTVTPDNPVCLSDFSGHTVWANSAALRAAGIGRDTPDPFGGTITRDAAGEPTGLLMESAQEAVQGLVPRPTAARRREAVTAAVRSLHALGITSYTEPGLGPGGERLMASAMGTDTLRAYADLAREQALRARVRVLLLPAPMGGSAAEVARGLAELAELAAEVTGPDTDPRLLSVIGVKVFADGIPPSRTAWMSEPYTDEGGHGSLCVHGADHGLRERELAEMIRVAHAAGHQIGVHVTGDRAIDAVTASFARAQRAHPRADARHYIIHGDFAGPDSLRTLAEHGYGANMNPAIKWTISDLMDGMVGAERSRRQWPMRSALNAGIAVCASSDAPITEPDWRQGLASMMLRESKASGRASGPQECLDLADAVRAYTVNPARQDFAEAWKGSLTPGMVADLCVLGGDLRATDPHDIPHLPVDLTVFGGEVVHGEG